MPKFHELKNTIQAIKDPQEIEQYIRKELIKHQDWKSASDSLKSLGKRTENFYKSILEDQFQNKPTFSPAEKIKEIWK